MAKYACLSQPQGIQVCICEAVLLLPLASDCTLKYAFLPSFQFSMKKRNKRVSQAGGTARHGECRHVFRNKTAELCSSRKAAVGTSLQRQTANRRASTAMPFEKWHTSCLPRSPSQKLSPKARRGTEQSNLNDQGIGASFLWGMYKSVGLFSDGL